MKKNTRAELEEIEKVLSKYGLSYTLKKGGKHMQVEVLGRKLSLTGTPRCGEREVRNYGRQNANRLIERLFEEGLVRPLAPNK